MNYRGHIKNGIAVLDTPIMLPDGTAVRVEIEPIESSFWSSRTVDELAAEQGVKPIQSVDELAFDWPAEDSIDDFLALVREVRR